jgi:hypothetical protein
MFNVGANDTEAGRVANHNVRQDVPFQLLKPKLRSGKGIAPALGAVFHASAENTDSRKLCMN